MVKVMASLRRHAPLRITQLKRCIVRQCAFADAKYARQECGSEQQKRDGAGITRHGQTLHLPEHGNNRAAVHGVRCAIEEVGVGNLHLTLILEAIAG